MTIGKKIGSGLFGQVFLLAPDDRYVLKTTKKENVYQFKKEIEIGSIPGIQEVGPRVYCYKKTSDNLMYIMDNVAKMDGCNNCKSMSLDEYFKDNFSGQCPLKTHPIVKMLARTLIRFYTITKGWHGDLHFGNIMVILDNDEKLKSIKLIDYGTHQKFINSNKNLPECLKGMFERINSNFSKNKNVFEHEGHKVKRLKNNQLLYKNTNSFGPEISQRLVEANKNLRTVQNLTNELRTVHSSAYPIYKKLMLNKSIKNNANLKLKLKSETNIAKTKIRNINTRFKNIATNNASYNEAKQNTNYIRAKNNANYLIQLFQGKTTNELL
jgi:predicted unusual protein kinase regulating ubiquinone biosynthesis (AarF/ABC1/UbiB family)